MAVEVRKWRPRGSLLLGTRDETVSPARPGVFGVANCADQISLALTVDYVTHNSKCAAIDVEDFRQVKSLSGEVTIDFSDYTVDNVLAALDATKVAAEASPVTVTAEVLPTVILNDTVSVGGANPHFNLTSVTITDSAGTPATLVLNTNYTLDAVNGMITFINLGSLVQPFKANYTHADPIIIAALAAGQVERWARFNGFNVADVNRMVDVDMFRVRFSPTAAFDLLPDDIGKLQLKGAVLIDLTRSSTDPRGQFFTTALGR